MITSQEGFAFVDGGRTYSCRVETGNRPNAEPWWWFRVSSEDNHRYAPFRAAADDTDDAVRLRVVAYYENLLARRAEPSRGPWPRRRDGAPNAVTPNGGVVSNVVALGASAPAAAPDGGAPAGTTA